MRQPGAATPALAVTAPARDLCRALGLTAIVVLQDVTLDARIDPTGQLVAETNVRRIAAHLGISKDTAARALVRLVDAGLVTRGGKRRGTNGAFASSGYELHLGPDVGVGLGIPAQGPALRCPEAKDGAVAPTADSRTAGRRSSGGSSATATRRSDRAGAPPRGRRASRIDQQALFDAADESSLRR